MESMGRPSRYSPEVRERAVRLVLEHEREHDSQRVAQPAPRAVHSRPVGRNRRQGRSARAKLS